MQKLVLVVALGCVACDDGDAVGDADGAVLDMGGMSDMRVDAAPDGAVGDGGLIAYDNPPVPDFTALPFPRTATGNIFMTHNAGVTLYVDPDRVTPAARAGRCVRTLLACLDTPGATPDACMRSTPHCADPAYDDPQTPLCCPADCNPLYEQARAAGAEPLAAIKSVVLSADGCMPGLGEEQ